MKPNILKRLSAERKSMVSLLLDFVFSVKAYRGTVSWCPSAAVPL